MNEVWRLIEPLPLNEKEQLCARLRKDIEEQRKGMGDEEMVLAMYNISDIVGVPYSAKSREHLSVVNRILIATFLLLKGYSSEKIGAVMGKHHATILYYKETFDNWNEFPKCYTQELGLWDKIINEI